MILSDIWAECGRLLNDPTNQRWPQAVLTIRANLAQTEIQGTTNAVKVYETLNISAGTSGISISSSVLDVLQVTYTDSQGNIRPLKVYTLDFIKFSYPDYANWQQGPAKFCYFDATNSQLNIVPQSDVAITGGLQVQEVRKPADLSAAADVPFDSNVPMTPYHIAIVHWVVAYCWMDNGDPESLKKAKFHKSGSMLSPGEYEKQIGRIFSKFDSPDVIATNIEWKPEGGRVGGWGVPSKSNPLPW